jgi:sugar lactone lactonase YvrE
MSVPIISGESIQCVLPWQAIVGESPIWRPEEQRLYWVDIQSKQIHRFDPSSRRNQTFDLPEIVTCVALRAAGGLVLTLRKHFAIFDPATSKLERIGEVEQELTHNRFNDGECDQQGRFWAGTMDAVEWSAPAGNLYRLGADKSVALAQENVICSNGIGWSPDGRKLYHTESFRHTIFVSDFEPETGDISNRRPFATLDSNSGGFPDGLTVDAEGFVWSNVVGLGQIRRYDSLGKIERVLQLPVPRATDCTFGGPDLKTLYITSARETMTLDQLAAAPLSGSLFAIDCGVQGLPAASYAG